MRPRARTPLALTGALTLASLCTVGFASYMRFAHVTHPRNGTPLVLPGPDGDATLLFNGWRISPAGRSLRTRDMLLGGAISPDGATLAIANGGWYPHALHLVDLASEKEIATLPITHAWNGIAWSPDSRRIYIAGSVTATDKHIFVVERDQKGTWDKADPLKLHEADPKKTCVSGLALSPDGATLYALNNSDDCLYVLSARNGAHRARLRVGDHPITCRLAAGGKTLYIANWGGGEVVAVDVSDTAKPAIKARMATGSHPNDIALSSDDRLFVSCGNADAVSVYDTRSRKLLETVRTTLTPLAPPGATPNALALTRDNKTLYVANADNNDLCVIDVATRGKSSVRGFIPTGWYPTAVLVSPDGKKVIVGSGKGTGTGPNGAQPPVHRDYATGFKYIAAQFHGMLSFVDAPDETTLAGYTRQVTANTPYRDAQLRSLTHSRPTAIPTRVGGVTPIKYVLYIIKENRTYDQVLGDLPKGNGDPQLVLFGREVTPNHHALAEQFVTLDNLYCNGEVSADGHPWSTSAIASDFTQRSWVLSYSAKGNTVRTDTVADPRNGYIWDACRRKGLTYRSYGEYVHATSSAEAPVQHMEGAPGLKGHGSPKWVGIGRPKELPAMRDTERADVFIEEFHEFEKRNAVPRFMIMSLGEDHTHGTSPTSFTPKAEVASNDYALGKIVDCISHSGMWKEFAIFVIEDDAQNGGDHVDSHRTVGLVISPYVRRRLVDSTMYTTASLLRTMELILGLPPLTQYDAAATPMFESFQATPDLTPYSVVSPRIDLKQRNKATAYGAQESLHMDWSAYDRADPEALNRILWHSVKGDRIPAPAPVRRALLSPTGVLFASRLDGAAGDDD